ncbi:MAG: paraquat-inducible protein A [Gammaproteobacteria bacterium]|jgi:paraquat-inducible protein A
MRTPISLCARDVGLVRCHLCAQLHPSAASAELGALRCARCGGKLHSRKTDSVNRSTAFLVSAIVLYVPANTLPVMTVVQLGRGAPDTILSGIESLARAGMWPLAALVFFASFVVPISKMLVLGYLLLSVRLGWQARLRDRARLYRLTEAVGRWSMIDIYVVTVLVALVHVGNIANISPGLGAALFAAVVILTMLSARSFDPRLMWDVARRPVLE